MTAALTPDLALAYLRELQPDLAGAEIGPPGAPLEGATQALRVRAGNQEIAVLPGPNHLPKLLAHDAERVAQVLNR